MGRSERAVWMRRHSGCQVARGKPRYSAGNSAPCAGMISGGGMGAPGGGDTCVHRADSHCGRAESNTTL